MSTARFRLTRRAALAGAVALPLARPGAPDTARAAEAPIRMVNILPIKEDAMVSFLPIMQANAKGSRQEPGNEAFWVFQSETGKVDHLYLFEAWASSAALEAHHETDHLQAVIKHAKTALAGDQTSLKVHDVPSVPPFDTRTVTNGGMTRNILVMFHVKPDERAAFIAECAEIVGLVRKTEGNEICDFFAVEGQPDSFVLLERWKNASAHEANLQKDTWQNFIARLPGYLSSPPQRIMMRDVAP